jgi:hypothetical protein
MDLTIVVVSFNTREHLERTLSAAIADCAGLEAEIVVIDNASEDTSAAAVRAGFPAVRLITNAENRFYTAANNQGFAAARGRYVLVLNSDAEIRPGTLGALLEALDARPEVGVASCRLTWPDGRLQRNCATERSYQSLLLGETLLGFLLAPVRARLRARDWYAGWDRESEREVGVLPGSFLLIRRSALDDVGGFDEDLRLYFAEDELCARIRQRGHGVRYLPVGAVVHEEGASVRRIPRRARRIYFEDLERYAGKRFGPARARLLAILAWPVRLGLDLAGRLRGETS